MLQITRGYFNCTWSYNPLAIAGMKHPVWNPHVFPPFNQAARGKIPDTPHVLLQRVHGQLLRALGPERLEKMAKTETRTSTIPSQLPSGKHTNSYWKWPFIVSFPIKKWWFSIATWVYQRVLQKLWRLVSNLALLFLWGFQKASQQTQLAEGTFPWYPSKSY